MAYPRFGLLKGLNMPALSVLIVDDDRGDRQLESLALQEAWGDVLIQECSSGGDALTFLQQTQVDWVLLDGHLPDISGLDVLRHLKASGYDKQIVILTGAASQSDHDVYLQAGATQVLVKAMDLDDLIDDLADLKNKTLICA